jgi:hypothetical protein
MAEPAKKRRVTVDRIRLVVDAVAALTAIVAVIVAVMKDREADAKAQDLALSQEQEQNLSVEITNLIQEVDEGDAELEALQSQLDELQATDAPTGDPVSGDASGFVVVDTAVDSEPCDNFGYGDWVEQAVQYAGDPYSRGFNCGMAKGSSTDTGGGSIDFLVPAGSASLSGLAGIDQNSDATEMRVTFAIYSVPNTTDPIWTAELGYGDIEPFDLDLTGVSRVRFEVTMLDAEEDERFQAGYADVQFTA